MPSIKNTKSDDCKQLLQMASFDARESSTSSNNEPSLNMSDSRRRSSLFTEVGLVLGDTIHKLSRTKSSNTATSTNSKQKKCFFLRYVHLPKSISFPVSNERLRVIFLLFTCFIALISFTIFLIIGYNSIQFKQQCLLYSIFDYEITDEIKTNYTINLMYFEQYPTVSYVYTYMVIAIVFAWFQVIFFIGSITILIIRLGTTELDNNIDNTIDDGKKDETFEKNTKIPLTTAYFKDKQQQQSNEINNIMSIKK
ncbi:unnamed protein product [Didymodactylos carnosus]|uniref:Uncharacterized protein n=1 Tax=Didymodactylos carnosus TaxID=1234261 RepID=A0A813RPQ1_9BILA|nr:unnamed protein product [Didymodactylos carnosus]CAF3567586.1 unnamed protein product [Didymodactylos carnosus]